MRCTLLFFLSGLFILPVTFAQTTEGIIPAEKDSVPAKAVITFTTSSASDYILNLMKSENTWSPAGGVMKHSLTRLLDDYREPFDSVRNRLYGFNFESISPMPADIRKNDTLPVRWLNPSTFIIDTLPLEKEPFVIRKTLMVKAIDSSTINFAAKIPELKTLLDSILQVRDTITEVFIDSTYLKSKKIITHRIIDGRIVPPVLPTGSRKTARFMSDSTRIITSETSRVFVASKESPFYIVSNDQMPDSLKIAVITLLSHAESRDSILVNLRNIDGRKTPFWLSSREDELYRFWVKNQANDSITLWIGNPTKYDIAIILEDNISVERREKKSADNIPITTLRPQRTLTGLKPMQEMPVFWDYGLASAFTLNQTFLSNWSKGGESSWSGMLDLRGSGKYTNKEVKTQWTNNGRLRYGAIVTKENGFRTNTDIMEINSQFNKVLREKLDFSSVFYFKTQVAKGYNYPNDSVVISKFLNPGTFTIGVGVEYKPFKKTSLNFSPLSYRNTFVLDTVNINQKAHGIELDKRARQEMGGQLVITNSVSILKGLNISNSVRLFSGYLEKPENVDVDWELSLDKQINWFFMVRLNLHIIYDDDIRFPVLDSDNQPVLLPDGTPKRGPRTQFKEFLGLTLSFRL